MFGRIYLLIHFIIAFLAGLVFQLLLVYILTKIALCINHRNLSKTKGFQAREFGKIFFQIHFILTFLACIIFSSIYMDILTTNKTKVESVQLGKDFGFEYKLS